MSGSELVFYAAAGMAVFSALAMVTRRNAIVGAVWLVAAFLGVAISYVLLAATFLAAIQVLVYGGAIMVLFVFVIMVIDVDERGQLQHRRPSRVARLAYFGVATVVGGFFIWIVVGTWARQFKTTGADISGQPGFGSAESVGTELFGRYLFGFESVSLLLLAAVIGAVVVARSRRERIAEESGLDPRTRARLEAGLAPEPGAPTPPGAATGPTPFTDFGKPSATGHSGD